MSLFSKTVSAALVASTLIGASLATSTGAEARGRFWGGFAVGAATGLIVSHAYRPAYSYGYYVPACHWEWRNGYYGSYKVKVCY